MKNCTTCEQTLTGAARSAKNENGDFYLICPNCGQVYLAQNDELGLTTLVKTRNGNDPETYRQMKEAKELFDVAGVNIFGFKNNIHSEKEDAAELTDKVSKEELEEIKSARAMFEQQGVKLPSLDKMIDDYVEFKKDPKAAIARALEQAFKNMLSSALENEECEDEDEDEDECDGCRCFDCSANEDCDNGCNMCDEEEYYEEEDDEEEDEYYEDEDESSNMMFEPVKFIVDLIDKGRRHHIKCKTKEEVANLFKVAEERNHIQILDAYELVPLKVTKKTSIEIN